MLQIEQIYLGSMNSGAHYEFMKRMLEGAKKDTTVKEKAAKVIEPWEQAFNKEDEQLKISTKSFISDAIAQADQQRDALYISYKKALDGLQGMPMEGYAEAAKVLIQKNKDYNIDVRAQLDKETGLLDNLLQDLQGPCKEQVALLNLTPVVDKLKELNEQVRTLMVQRTEERKLIEVGALRAARQAGDEAYRDFTTVVNALALMEGEAAYRDFITYANAEIKHFKQQILGSGTGNGSDTGTDSGNGTGSGTDSGTGSGSGSDTGNGSGTGSGSDTGSGPEME